MVTEYRSFVEPEDGVYPDMRAVLGQDFRALPPTMTVPSLRLKQRRMIRSILILAAFAPLCFGLFACASGEDIQAERVARQAANEAEDDAKCRSANMEPGSEPYETCRRELAGQRARQAEIDYQKARDFDRVLGGLDDR